jgi:aminomethyltransferase
MRHTPLFAEHEAAGAKVVDFCGWALPVQFAGIVREHQHTRSRVSVFDCSHMGEFRVLGEKAVRAYDELVCSDIAGLKVGRARYGAILNESGGIVDDVITLKLDEQELLVVANAGPLKSVSALLCSTCSGITDISADISKIDVQGPLSCETLVREGLGEAERLKYFTHCRTEWCGESIVLSRTGYTGELGYELFVTNKVAPALWRALIAHDSVEPAGLGARDTLRIEMGYPLSGQDFDETRTPLEINMESFVAWHSTFTGQNALKALRDCGDYPRITAIRTSSRQAPRHGFDVFWEREQVGLVTSGTFGPSVGHGIGLAFLPDRLTKPGIPLEAGPRRIPIETAELPFYKEGTCRKSPRR